MHWPGSHEAGAECRPLSLSLKRGWASQLGLRSQAALETLVLPSWPPDGTLQLGVPTPACALRVRVQPVTLTVSFSLLGWVLLPCEPPFPLTLRLAHGGPSLPLPPGWWAWPQAGGGGRIGSENSPSSCTSSPQHSPTGWGGAWSRSPLFPGEPPPALLCPAMATPPCLFPSFFSLRFTPAFSHSSFCDLGRPKWDIQDPGGDWKGHLCTGSRPEPFGASVPTLSGCASAPQRSCSLQAPARGLLALCVQRPLMGQAWAARPLPGASSSLPPSAPVFR